MMIRRLAVLVFTGVPAIIGGGIVYAISDHSYTMVAVYEAILYACAFVLAAAGLEKTENSHH
ncbi:MAG: hypothetical protein AB1921_09460 [Thermodesulfobacteriota bacterium]